MYKNVKKKQYIRECVAQSLVYIKRETLQHFSDEMLVKLLKEIC